MSAVTGILTGIAKVQRPKSFLLDNTAIQGVLTVNRQPSQSGLLEVVVDGCTIGGGSSVSFQTDVGLISLGFTANEVQRSTAYVSSISGITTAGLTGGFISVKSVNGMGQPQTQLVTVYESLPVRFYTHKGRLRYQKPGQMESGMFNLIAEPTADLAGGDIITALSGLEQVTIGRITHHDHIYDFDGVMHHVEAECSNII